MFEHLVLAGARGDRHARRDVGARVRDEDLRAVDDPAAVAQLGGRARCAGVGARARLGQAEGRELLTGREVGQPLLLLRLVAEVVDRQRAERVVRGDRDRDRRVDAGQLLDRDRVRERVRAAAAVLLGNRHAHEAELGQLGDELVREATLAVELLGDRRDSPLGEVANGRADELVLRCQVVVQAERRVASSAISRTP